MRRAIAGIATIFIFFIIVASTNANSLWPEPRAIPEGSNYLEGVGNISYPTVSNISSVGSLLPNTILVGNIMGDKAPEIIGVSYLDYSLKIFDSELNLLWSFQDRNDTSLQKEKDYWDLIPAVTIGDVDGDGAMEIAFSLTSADSDSSTLHLFKGSGTELWRLEIDGKITKYSLHMCDVNGDDENEILFGAKQIYVVSGNGTLIYRSNINLDDFQGISNIVVNGSRVVATIWHYSKEELSDMTNGPVNTSTRPIYSEYVLYYFVYENGTLSAIWNRSLETSADSFSEYNGVFASPKFEYGLLVKQYSLEVFDIKSGNFLYSIESPKNLYPSPFSSSLIITNKGIFWNGETFIMYIENGGVQWMFSANTSLMGGIFHSISLFDVNNDGVEELIAKKGWGKIMYIDVEGGEKIGEYDICTSEKEAFTPTLIHADIDNDGFDEIITTDPEGRIVIIDNGTPPKEEKLPIELVAIAGIGTIITTSAVIWIWRKKRNEK